MARPVVQLGDFDPEPLVEYAITEHELTNIYQYLQAMQSHLNLATWDDIAVGGYYGTSALLHEVVEVRILMNRDPYFLMQSAPQVRQFARLPQNRDAHVRGLEVEYAYLHKIIQSVYDVQINIGALLKVNSTHPQDWDDLFDTDLPFFAPTKQETEDARKFLTALRNLGKRIP